MGSIFRPKLRARPQYFYNYGAYPRVPPGSGYSDVVTTEDESATVLFDDRRQVRAFGESPDKAAGVGRYTQPAPALYLWERPPCPKVPPDKEYAVTNPVYSVGGIATWAVSCGESGPDEAAQAIVDSLIGNPLAMIDTVLFDALAGDVGNLAATAPDCVRKYSERSIDSLAWQTDCVTPQEAACLSYNMQSPPLVVSNGRAFSPDPFSVIVEAIYIDKPQTVKSSYDHRINDSIAVVEVEFALLYSDPRV